MADDSAVPALPVYQVPDADTNTRQQRRQPARADRAELLLELVSLVPGKDHGEALRLLLELEAAHTETTRDLCQSWLRTVQRAYETGRVEASSEALEHLTGEPCGPRVPGSTLTH
jgi:hypothetical protein